MGLLDDLKNQANDQRDREQREKQRWEQLESIYRDEIHPRMTEVYQYLNELVEHLNYLKPETLASYPILPQGASCTFRQHDYKLTVDSTRQTRNITLTCKAELAQPVRFSLEGREKVLRQKELLDSFKLRYDRKEYKNDSYELTGADFKLEGPINISVYFVGDVETSSVNLVMSNFEQPGAVRHVLKARHLNREFLDKLGRYLLRKDDQFLNLDISDDHKQTIRQMLEQERLRREQEIAEMERQAREEAEQDKARRRLLNIFNKDK